MNERSGRGLTYTLAAFALAGLGVAIYLTVVKYSGGVPTCSIIHGCQRVQDSAYAEISGMPIPILGIIGYTLILASLLVLGDRGRMLTALLALVGFGFSAYLTYLELFVIDALCQWCVISAATMTAVAVCAVIRVLRV